MNQERGLGHDVVTRRLRTAGVLSSVLHHEFRETQEGQLAKVEILLSEGYGVVGLVPHFSYGDFMRVISSLLQNSPVIQNREMLIPLAVHQDRPLMRWMEAYTQIQLANLITLDTRKKEKVYVDKGQRVPWQSKVAGSGDHVYMGRAAEVLKRAGVIMVAPQGGRRPILEHFEKEAVRFIDSGARRLGVKKLAYMFFGIDAPHLKNYRKKGLSGMHPFRPYVVTLGPVMTSAGLRERAETNGRTIDQEAYAIMLELAPLNYRPDQAPQFAAANS